MQSPAGMKVPFLQIPIYLCVDSTPVACCTTDVFFDPALMTFREIYMPLDSEDMPWFTALIESAANQHQSSLPYTNIDYYYDHKIEGDTFGSSVVFPLAQRSPVSVTEITAKLQEILPGTRVELSDGSSVLSIHMNLPVDENLIERIFSLTPRFYEAVSINKEFYETVCIYPFEAAGDERCQIIFEQNSDGGVSFTGSLFNGRLAPYKDEIAEAIEKDTFFKSLISDDYSGWVYRDF